MKKLLEYLPFHFLLCLILGIFVQFQFEIWALQERIFYVVFASLVVLLFLFRQNKTFTFFTQAFFFFLGVFLVYQSDFRNNPAYFENYTSEEQTVVLRVRKILKSSSYFDKYEAIILQVESNQTVGKTLMNVQKDSAPFLLNVDDEILVKTTFEKINKPLNPHQFDYSEYLEKQGVCTQIKIDKSEILLLKNSTYSLAGFAHEVRSKIEEKLKAYEFSANEFAVINALLLGQRQEISQDLLDDYSQAGAIHILAVSGLHVGIIMLIITFLLKPLERLKYGKITKLFITVVFLWFFAFLAGLSPSVVRAVTMFSAVSLGVFLQRKNSVEYSLILSMFLLLLIKPMFLFEVGFQLSYLAVFGIIWVQPVLYKYWKPKYFILDKSWQLITVSVAAQFGVLPLSLFYFHQFPGLFLISNLVIIPVLGFILVFGVVVIILSQLSLLPEALAKLYGFIISMLNNFVGFISEQEQFLFSDIGFSAEMILVCYALLIAAFCWIRKPQPKESIALLSFIICLQLVIYLESSMLKSKEQFIVFHQSRKSILAYRNGTQLLVNIESAKSNYNIKNYIIGENIDNVQTFKIGNFNRFHENQIVILDSIGVYNIRGLKSPIVLLTNSPKINIERLLKTLQPKQIIADGSNYKSMVTLWAQYCKRTKTPFWYTGQNGAYILEKK